MSWHAGNSNRWEKLKYRELGGKKDYLSLAQNSESLWTEVNNMWVSSGLWGKAGCPQHEFLKAYRNMKSDFNPCNNQWSSNSSFLQWSCCVCLGNTTPLTLSLASQQDVDDHKTQAYLFLQPVLNMHCKVQPWSNSGAPALQQPTFFPSSTWTTCLIHCTFQKLTTCTYLCENLGLHPYFTKKIFLNILFQKHHNTNKWDESISPGSLEKS